MKKHNKSNENELRAYLTLKNAFMLKHGKFRKPQSITETDATQMEYVSPDGAKWYESYKTMSEQVEFHASPYGIDVCTTAEVTFVVREYWNSDSSTVYLLHETEVDSE